MQKNVPYQTQPTTKKYVHPNKRIIISKFQQAEKKELKKEFQLDSDTNAFPSLISNQSLSEPKKLSFANVAKITPIINNTIENKTLPGWVYIRKNNGIIQYKYGQAYSGRYPSDDDEIKQDARLTRILLKYLIEREQYKRDMDVIRLGDLSRYYNAKTIQEIIEDEEENNIINYDYYTETEIETSDIE